MSNWKTRSHYSLENGWNSRGYIPHFDHASVFQFITFRVAHEPLLLAHVNSGSLEPAPAMRLDDDEIGEMLCKSILSLSPGCCELADWAVMPDHLHLLLKRNEGYELAKLIKGFKSVTSRRIGRIKGTKGKVWDRDYFDTYIRDAEHFKRVSEYIRWNPVTAGLVSRPEDWPFGSAGYAGSLELSQVLKSR